jgi:hypothetical protein
MGLSRQIGSLVPASTDETDSLRDEGRVRMANH